MCLPWKTLSSVRAGTFLSSSNCTVTLYFVQLIFVAWKTLWSQVFLHFFSTSLKVLSGYLWMGKELNSLCFYTCDHIKIGCCCCQCTSVVSDSVWPHRRQPTRLPHPWDSPGKNTGVGCHYLLQCMKVKSEGEVAQLCLTLRDPMDRSLPGSSIHGIFQARVLEWVAIAFSKKLAKR